MGSWNAVSGTGMLPNSNVIDNAIVEQDVLRDAIAVVGMSCRFPGANNPQEFWEVLCSGEDAIRPFPEERVREAKNRFGLESDIKAGFLKCRVDEFDANFFGISPREAPLIDPQQRLLLEVAWESLEDAGINAHELRGTSTGVFTGIWQPDYDRILHTTTRDANDLFHRYFGNAFSATASRVSYYLGLHGPAIALESGCSSSLGAIHLACQSLLNGESSLAIAGGVNLILIGANPFTDSMEVEGDSIVLSKDFKCKTFDESANGFVRAEGCGVVILKKFHEAVNAGCNILGIVRGSAMNNDGNGGSFGTPNAQAQVLVFEKALEKAGVTPDQVSFLEAHGTGTPVGDPIEMEAIRRVYSKKRTSPLYISSVKTNIGHCEASAGIASVIKAILCMQKQRLPPHLNLNKLNPYINLDQIPAIIPTEITEWTTEKRICAVSSFSMSATNVHVILQEAVPAVRAEAATLGTTDRPLIITISAKSKESLNALIAAYVKFLENNTKIALQDFAYAVNVTRAPLTHRIALTASSVEEVLEKLKSQDWSYAKASNGNTKVAFLFPGQGCQYTGMLKHFAEKFQVFRNALNEANEIFEACLQKKLTDVMWENPNLLNQSLYCQPAIVAVEYALTQLWKSFGIVPEAVLGHSLGEITAAILAGVLSLEQGLKLIIARSRLVDKLEKGSMIAVTSSEQQTKLLIAEFQNSRQNEWIDVAAVNSNSEVVVSGPTETINEFLKFCIKKRVEAVGISTQHAFHSRQMDDVLKPFGTELESIVETTKVEPILKFISGTEAKVVETGEEFGPGNWKRHLRNPVQFSRAIQILLQDDFKTFVEVGPSPVLLGITMTNAADTSFTDLCLAPSARRSDTTGQTFQNSLIKLYLEGHTIDWRGQTPIRRQHLDIPKYQFQRQSYWIGQSDEAESEENGQNGFIFGGTAQHEKLHPLLGFAVCTPASVRTFVNLVNVKDYPYLADHKVAGLMVYPAAAFIETAFGAAREILQGGGTLKCPLTLEKFGIDAALDVASGVELHTTVEQIETERGVSYNLEIFKKLKNGTFKRNISTKFLPGCKVSRKIQFDISEIKGRLEEKESGAIGRVYSGIAARGIEFGPRFQSIKSVYASNIGEFLAEICISEISNPSDYICHPVVIDSLFQTKALQTYFVDPNTNSNDGENKICLPISIEQITWFSETFTPTLYSYCFPDKNDDDHAVFLINENGNVLLELKGVELIETTAETVLNSIEHQVPNNMNFSAEVWRPIPSFTPKASNVIKNFCNVSKQSDKLQTALSGLQRVHDINHSDESFHKFGILSIINAIQLCSWPYQVGLVLNREDWTSRIPENVPAQVVDYYLYKLQKEGYIQSVPISVGSGYYALKQLESPSNIDATIADLLARSYKHDEVRFSCRWLKKFYDELPLVLSGRMSPIEYHFPADTSKLGAIAYYNEELTYRLQCELAMDCLMQTVNSLVMPMSDYTDEHNQPISPSEKNLITLEILEVGGGSGMITQMIISQFKSTSVQFEYTFTDISPFLVETAKKTFSSYTEVVFQTLDIEQDPLPQGYLPESFDVILASQVLHATRNLVETLQNLRVLLRPGGRLIFAESFGIIENIELVFGLLEGWWRFSDFRKEAGSVTPVISSDKWRELLKNTGFQNITTIEAAYPNGVVVATKSNTQLLPNNTALSCEQYSKPNWILVSDQDSLAASVVDLLQESNRNVTRYSVEDCVPKVVLLDGNMEGIIFFWTRNDDSELTGEEEKYIGSLLQLLKTYADTHTAKHAKIRIVTRGAFVIGDDEIPNPKKAALWGLVRAFRNEYPKHDPFLIDFGQVEAEDEGSQLFATLFSPKAEEATVFRGKRTYVLRFVDSIPQRTRVKLPNCERYRFINPASGYFADIKIDPDTASDLRENDVEVAVRACALNFKDIFCVLKPKEFEIPKEHLDHVGLDVSGVVTRVGTKVTRYQVGDEVVGVSINGAIASHTVSSELGLWKKPKGISFESAAACPIVYLTAHYALHHIAKLQPGERVLIHAGSGGVGLAAIDLVKKCGGRIFATVGSKRKRRFLEQIYGITHVYNSRNTHFGQQILDDTNGQGVDIVLNCLTGPGFKEASLSATALNGRFVELAKMNIWTTEEVSQQRPDVEYKFIELVGLDFMGQGDFPDIMHKMEQEFGDSFPTLPCKVFSLENIQTAFYYLQEAKQIGKVVLRMPTTEVQNGSLFHSYQMFNSYSTYLITGGLGGIGIELTKWMTIKGASNIVLVGRTAASTQAQAVVDDLRTKGFNILVLNLDISNKEDCDRLFRTVEESETLPPLKGIFHAAGVLHDAAFETQSWETLHASIAPKAHGAWNLHRHTLHMDLEFFVLFSSGASLFGSIGQAPHTTANKYLDGFAWYRHSMGFPATSINWGLWKGIGAGRGITNDQENRVGLKGFPVSEGLMALEQMMNTEMPQIGFVPTRGWKIMKTFFSLGHHYWDEVEIQKEDVDRLAEMQKEIELIKGCDPSLRQEKLQAFLESIIKETLRLPKDEVLDIDQPLSEMGVDSLMAMEMKTRLEKLTARNLPISAIQENRTIRKLSSYLARVLATDQDPQTTAQLDQSEVLKSDSILPCEMRENFAIVSAQTVVKRDFKSILLTGGTGHFGAHVLPEIQKMDKEINIFCLVRAASDETARDILQKTLAYYDLLGEVNFNQISVIAGDVCHDLLGLPQEKYDLLTQQVDAVVHCGAKVNHIESYYDGSGYDMRSVNVKGLLRILRFCTDGRLKHIIYPSALLCVTELDADGTIPERWLPLNSFEKIQNGYLQSKSICEALLQQAAEAGLPVTLLRIPFLYASSVTGIPNRGFDHVWTLISTCIRLRKFPNLVHSGGIPVFPVNICARICAEIFCNSESETGVYNLINVKEITQQDAKEIGAELGIEFEVVEFTEWRDAAFEDLDDDLMRPLFPIYADAETGQSNVFAFHSLGNEWNRALHRDYSKKTLKNLPGIEAINSFSPQELFRRRLLNSVKQEHEKSKKNKIFT